MTFVSIVVPTRNRAELLRDCIQGLLEQDFPADRYEIIVVDDGSTDDTARVVQVLSAGHGSPGVRRFWLPKLGVNAARNEGIRNATGDIVCIVDDDELVQSTHLRSVVERLERAPDLDGVGGPYRPFARTRIRVCGRCTLGAADFPGVGNRKVKWLFGGNMAVRRAVFQRRGLFDEELSGFGDEYEWFHRGPSLELLYDPDLWVWHRRDHQTLMELCKSAWRQGLAIPLSGAKVGIIAAPSVLQLLRYLAHATIRLCGAGLVLACREAGALNGPRIGHSDL
jgi:glycosyltransferase involved in cell wall biosynthesis